MFPGHPDKKTLDIMGAWLVFLWNAEWITQIAANVVVLYCIFPAYKHTRQLAFLLLGFAYLIGTFDTICDRTIGLTHMVGYDFVLYRTFRRLSCIAVIILSTMGLLLLVRGFLKLKGITPPQTITERQGHPGFFTRIWRKMEE